MVWGRAVVCIFDMRQAQKWAVRFRTQSVYRHFCVLGAILALLLVFQAYPAGRTQKS